MCSFAAKQASERARERANGPVYYVLCMVRSEFWNFEFSNVIGIVRDTFKSFWFLHFESPVYGAISECFEFFLLHIIAVAWEIVASDLLLNSAFENRCLFSRIVCVCVCGCVCNFLFIFVGFVVFLFRFRHYLCTIHGTNADTRVNFVKLSLVYRCSHYRREFVIFFSYHCCCCSSRKNLIK